MKKICFVDFDMTITGGVEQVTASLVNNLCDKYRIYLWGLTNSQGELAYKINPSVTYKEINGEGGRLRSVIRKNFKPFWKFVREQQIDVVVMMGNYPALVIGGTRFFTRAKYVYCDHGALMNQWHQKDITLIRFLDVCLAHQVVVLTEKTKQDYQKKFHVSEKKIQCIYNWIDTEVLIRKKEYNIESKKILTVGRFGKEKGYDLLVEVASKVLAENPNWQWHIYGTGETFEEISQLVSQKGLTNRLLLKGNKKDVYRMFGEYSFLVLTSYREGLPLVLLEATALGLPMISFDIETGPSEIIVDGKSGYLIEPYNTDKMGEMVNELIKNPNRRIECSRYTQSVVKKFDKEKILHEWATLFESVCKM